MKIIRCPHCGKMFKITGIENNKYITDWNGTIYNNQGTGKCLCCYQSFEIKSNSMNTEDWIAHLIFHVKGG